jgi:hypothetical protein
VEKEGVDLVQSELAVARVKRAQRLVITVIAVPQLGGNEDVLAPYLSRGERYLQRRPDLGLVAVHRGSVDVPVSGFECPAHRVLSGAAATRLIDAKAEARDRDSVAEADLV